MLFRPFTVLPDYRPVPGEAPADSVRLRWLGVAGWVIAYRDTVLLIDPYVSRYGMATVALATLVPDRGTIDRYVPRAAWIAVGHSHYDHLLDVPAIARRDGATVIGSASTATVLRAAGVPESQVRAFPADGGTIRAGDMTVTLVRGRHGKALLGRVPLPGEVSPRMRWPARLGAFRAGDVYGVLVRAGDVAIYHNGSADVVDDALAGHTADVVLAGIAGSAGTPDYLGRLVRALSPSVLIPTHYDVFFSPLAAGPRVLPMADLDGFFADARRAAPGAAVVVPEPLQSIAVGPGGRVVAVPS
jgi:L-ascorbate metabolism protein UlaG (beta-lactamase superfamily)